MNNTAIHYNSSLSLLVMKSQGEGACGEAGTITGYHGVVNCKACQVVIQQENEVSVFALKQQLERHYAGK